jgi:hypothetical protein
MNFWIGWIITAPLRLAWGILSLLIILWMPYYWEKFRELDCGTGYKIKHYKP